MLQIIFRQEIIHLRQGGRVFFEWDKVSFFLMIEIARDYLNAINKALFKNSNMKKNQLHEKD